MFIYIYTYTAYIYTYIYTHIYAHIYSCIHIYIYIHSCTQLYIHLYAFIYPYIHKYPYIYIYTYMYTTHTHPCMAIHHHAGFSTTLQLHANTNTHEILLHTHHTLHTTPHTITHTLSKVKHTLHPIQSYYIIYLTYLTLDRAKTGQYHQDHGTLASNVPCHQQESTYNTKTNHHSRLSSITAATELNTCPNT